MTYNQANRLATVGSLGPFTYNADGQRTTKPAPSGTTVFHYGMDGLLLAETTEAGSLIRVYFWAEDTPIAQMDTELTYLHADHLDTPRIGTNSSGTIVWQWSSDAFGSLLPNEDPDGDGTPTTVNLRFPGQYFDQETGLHYNYFRDYDPRIGRYLESDPIGLMGGLNTFGYVRQNPLGFVDPTGEIVIPPAIVAGAIIGGISGGFGAAANGGNIVSGALIGAVGGGFVGVVGSKIGTSLFQQSLLRAGAGGFGNVLGQKNNSNSSTKFNSGSFAGSIFGGLFGGFYAPATWGVNFAGSYSSQLMQRIIAGLPGASVSGTSNIVGTQLGRCD